MNKTNELTIFTPTYNRAYILPNLYESLISQTNHNFEWIIVDDGSTDNTEGIVKNWINEHKINIRYYYQNNSGKMQAHNIGVNKASSDLFICVDSDDYLFPTSVEKILECWKKEYLNEKICGILAPRKMIDFKSENLDNINIRSKYITLTQYNNTKTYKGETALAIRTKILKQYLFPKIDNEKFLTEDYIYAQIDYKYKYIFLKEYIIACKYQEDGYTNHYKELIIKNPKGYLLYFSLKSNLSDNLKQKIIYSLLYVAMAQHLCLTFKETIHNAKEKLLTFCFYPFGKYLKSYIFKKFMGLQL